MSNGKKTLVSRVESPSLDKDKLQRKYPDMYDKHCNLFNEKSFKEDEAKIYEECSFKKQSTRLHLPRIKAV